VLDHPPGRDLIKVLDFGLAKSLVGDGDHAHSTVTRSDVILGTPSYISPELIAGGVTDARADLYSVGVLLYEMLSGRLPFRAETVNVLLAKHAYEEPDPLDERFPQAVRDVIMRLLAKAPETRFQTAAETRLGLQDAMEGIPSQRAITAASGPVPTYTTPSDAEAAMMATVDAHKRKKAAAVSSPETAIQARPTVKKRRTGLWIALALVAASAVGGVTIAMMRGGSDTSDEASEPIAAADTTPDAGVEAAAPPPAVDPTTKATTPPAIDAGIELIDIHIVSKPRGAKITLDGKSMGKTPKTLSLPKSSKASKLKLSHRNYRTKSVDLTPDEAQKLSYKLDKKRRLEADPKPPPPKPDPDPVRPPLVFPDE
jgi:serine/threonine-protein kinase